MASWGNCFESIEVNGEVVSNNVATIRCLEPLFSNVITAVVYLVGIALFIMLLVGGFGFLFSGGDAKKTEQAQKTLSSAIGGLVIIVAAYLILLLIKAFTGIDVTQFKISP